MRLIDADELMEHVYRDRLDSRDLIAQMIKNAPTARNTGKWERQYSRPGELANYYWWCSCCMKPIKDDCAGLFYQFCPRCGAKMGIATED